MKTNINKVIKLNPQITDENLNVLPEVLSEYEPSLLANTRTSKSVQLSAEAEKLTEDIINLNKKIKSNPQITAENVYEIIKCNVRLSEILSEDDKEKFRGLANTKTSKSVQLPAEIKACYLQVIEMGKLSDIEHHPFFFRTGEDSFFQMGECSARDLYNVIKHTQIIPDYDVPEDKATREIKQELLCKSISVPFHIWQEQRRQPDYEYDNDSEWNGMKMMLDIYKQEGNTQFVPEIEALFRVIERNYKKESKAEKKQV